MAPPLPPVPLAQRRSKQFINRVGQGFAREEILHYSDLMVEERIESAIGRIEAALARIASCAETMRPAPPSVSGLVVKHEQLRERVAASLRELDDLIARLEP
jgi:hypothetical protein